MSVPVQAWMAGGYALLLVSAAGALLWFAGHHDGVRHWPRAAVPELHRGMARVLLLVALFILAVVSARHPTSGALAIVIPVATLAVTIGYRSGRR